MSGDKPNESSSDECPSEQPNRRRRREANGAANGAARAGGTSAIDSPVVEIVPLPIIIGVANINTGTWVIRRLPWISRALQLDAQHPGQVQQIAATLNQELPHQAPATAIEVAVILILLTMGEVLPVFSLHIELNMANIRLAPPSEEEIPHDLSDRLFFLSSPVEEDDARVLHTQFQALYSDRVRWPVALSYLTMLHRMAVPEEVASTDSEFDGE